MGPAGGRDLPRGSGWGMTPFCADDGREAEKLDVGTTPSRREGRRLREGDVGSGGEVGDYGARTSLSSDACCRRRRGVCARTFLLDSPGRWSRSSVYSSGE